MPSGRNHSTGIASTSSTVTIERASSSATSGPTCSLTFVVSSVEAVWPAARTPRLPRASLIRSVCVFVAIDLYLLARLWLELRHVGRRDYWLFLYLEEAVALGLADRDRVRHLDRHVFRKLHAVPDREARAGAWNFMPQ